VSSSRHPHAKLETRLSYPLSLLLQVTTNHVDVSAAAVKCVNVYALNRFLKASACSRGCTAIASTGTPRRPAQMHQSRAHGSTVMYIDYIPYPPVIWAHKHPAKLCPPLPQVTPGATVKVHQHMHLHYGDMTTWFPDIGRTWICFQTSNSLPSNKQ
jgi:hypothetical protein